MKFNTTIQMGLISCLFISYLRISGGEDLILEIESYGRDAGLEGVDLSRTIGWFTSLYPLKLKIGGKKSPAEIINYVKDKMNAIPRQGIGYGLLRYLNEKTNKSLKKINIPISFNYLGRYHLESEQGRIFELSSKYTGKNIGSKNHREYQLEVNCGISDGCLSIDFNFNRLSIHRDSMLRLIDTFELVISEIIDEGMMLGSVNYSPSDFPLAGIDKAKLEKIIKKTTNQ
jgi:non-ribosomal peptide synthase protein (TIGR01720 family)